MYGEVGTVAYDTRSHAGQPGGAGVLDVPRAPELELIHKRLCGLRETLRMCADSFNDTRNRAFGPRPESAPTKNGEKPSGAFSAVNAEIDELLELASALSDHSTVLARIA